MERFDIIIIGAGPAGYAAAMRALDFGKKVLILEKNKLGGAGLHNGALSSKTWWELSREHAFLNDSIKKHKGSVPKVSFQSMYEEVSLAVQERRHFLHHHLDLVSKNGYASGSLKFLNGKATITAPHQVKVESAKLKEHFEADYIILATGSRPRKLDHIPIDEEIILTSDGIDHLDHFPKSMVILGAGVIGCEFATIFANFGQTKVHLIDKGDRILPFEDEDVVHMIEKNLESRGVLIHRNSRLKNMEIEKGEVCYTLEYTDGHEEKFQVEKALISVGRVPNYENLWSEKVAINTTERGIVDEDTKTSEDYIYAVGDITADIALVNIAELEGRYAVERIFGHPRRQLLYDNISTIMFLSPEVAGVGLNEIQAQKEGMNYRVVSLDYACISRAIAMRNTQGFIKILVTDDEEMKILGMRVIGEHASSAIEAVALLISMEKGIEELAELIHPHPSIIEGIQECVRMLLGKSVFKPELYQEYMRCQAYRDGSYVPFPHS